MNKSFALLFEVLNSFLKNQKLNTKDIDDETMTELFIVSKKHDLAHIVADVLYNNGVLKSDSEIAQLFKQAQFNALYRYTRQDYAKEQVYKLFEEEKIKFIPLKGSVLRDYYKEPYMRTSGDVDILVEEKNLNQAKNALCKKLGFLVNAENKLHDVSLYTPEGVHIELHFSILSNKKNIDRVLKRVWEYIQDTECFKKSMIPEYFMFHHISHMYYNFVNGGCGVRPFIDLYILKKELNYNEEGLQKLLDECKILKFYYSVMELLDVWFGEAKNNKITEAMEIYILNGGVYGSLENKTAINENIYGNRIKYLLRRLFMPYNAIYYRYPILSKHKWMYPFILVYRIISVISPKRRKRVSDEMQALGNIKPDSEKVIEEIIRFFEL